MWWMASGHDGHMVEINDMVNGSGHDVHMASGDWMNDGFEDKHLYLWIKNFIVDISNF